MNDFFTYYDYSIILMNFIIYFCSY